MQSPYLLLLASLTSLSLFAQTGNFGFEQRTATGQPVGWNSLSNDYLFTLDSAVTHGGRYALQVAYKNSGTFGGSHWRVPATFAGKKLTLKAFVKTSGTGTEPNTYAGLWMRIDDAASKALAFDNMADRGIKGTTDWQPCTITLTIPDEAASIHLGGILVGKGTAWFDDVELTVDGVPVEKAPAKVVKLSKAQTDTAFANGSGIELTALTKQQIDNLDLLGKVWGFVKYYHPAVTEGNHNMDAELFRIMPAVLKATSTAQRSEVLLNWLTTFGPVKTTAKEPDTTQAVLRPDLVWLTDVARLGEPLQAQLMTIRQAKRPNKSYYVSLFPQVGNPEFKNELPYRRMTTPDAGYRLLSLYRYWNIIQYFFPYKHLIGEDWNKVLPTFIPAFVNARDSLAYRLAALSLIGRIHDTHANVWGDQIIRKDYKGSFFSPVQVRYIENQFVVTNFFNDSLGRLSGLKRGDVVTSVDGVPTSALIQQRKPYYPASNEPTQLRDISRDLLAGHTNTVKLGIERAGKTQTVVMNRYKPGQAKFNDQIDYSSYPKDSCYQLLHPDIGYLFLGNIKANKLPDIMRLFSNTKGLVIDMRCYPSEFVVFSLGKYLTTPKLFAKFTAGNVETPGLFRWQSPILVGERSVREAYKGKVVILVNELTQSSAEYHTMAFRQAPGAVVLGSTTAAADGNISPFYLPGGLYTMISGIGVNYPDGRETQRIGVGVDVEMRPTRKGIESGRDELLEKAISLIRAGN
ncbi:S41 family peptidase [Spirosoma fluviale]|uniref:C-terminal processing protease CtpA/Prc, contains a PDZ domain n=1 Tax=Spirosoma fluviale TaxID=1597977 RepID=A0A286GAT5_9BACT|nr:S41 family peptidase [Spirosoma fluviale]SOD92620.1 C-terminal processing protease CtpA/Prc, contains a PDZ domain [Spirosoma fluviale]